MRTLKIKKAVKDLLRQNALPVQRLADPDVQERLRRVPNVWGYDPATGRLHLFFAAEPLPKRPASLRLAEPANSLVFELDLQTEEEERLRQAVLAARGSCCYPADAHAAPSRSTSHPTSLPAQAIKVRVVLGGRFSFSAALSAPADAPYYFEPFPPRPRRCSGAIPRSTP